MRTLVTAPEEVATQLRTTLALSIMKESRSHWYETDKEEAPKDWRRFKTIPESSMTSLTPVKTFLLIPNGYDWHMPPPP